MLHFLNYTLPRIKYILKINNRFSFKLLIIIRLIHLALIIYILKKKKHIFFGKFGENKFKINLDTMRHGHGTRGYFLLRNNQEPILKYGHKFIKKNDIIFDIGANQGVFSTSFLSKINKRGFLICVEPFDYAIKRIRLNCNINHFKNFKIYQNIISNKIKKTKIYFNDKISDASIINKNKNFKLIKSITIDQIVDENKLKKVSLIKLDVEGAEYLALKGSINTIKNFRPKFYIEINSETHFIKVFNFLTKFNYKCFIFNTLGKLERVKRYNPREKNIIFII